MCMHGLSGPGTKRSLGLVKRGLLVLSLVTALDPAVQRATCQGPRHCPHRLTAGICISRERMRWGVGMHPDVEGPWQ